MRILKSVGLVGVVCFMLAAGPAAAQLTSDAPRPATPPETASGQTVQGKDVIVTGRKAVEAKDAIAFARAASTPIDGQLARFNIPVCPMAIGFPQAMAAQIVTRMRDVVEAVGAKLEKPGCKGNMIVIAATDGAEMVREMRRLNTPLIDGVDFHEVNALIKAEGPVRSWTVTRVENAYGDPPVGSAAPGLRTLEVYSASHANPPTQQSIGLAVVIIDWSAMAGKTTIQIADYAALRTLAKTRPAKGGGVVATNLALFDSTTMPEAQLSEADLAYLHGLYAMPGASAAYYQTNRLATAVKKAAKRQP